jgi:PAS domain S-box-containing protein
MPEADDSYLRRPHLRFVVAVVVVVAAFLLRLAMVRYIGDELPAFITFYPAVMVAALLCGLGPGLLATGLSVLAADYWILPPRGSFGIASPSDGVALAFFALMGVFLSLVAEAYRRNQQRVAALKSQLALHEAQEKQQRTEEQFATLANAIPQLCWMANPDGWIFWYNRRWFEYTGTTPEQMEGWGWQSVHDPVELPKVLERWKASIATGEPFDMVFPLRSGDGVFRPFLTRVMPVKDAAGKIVRWFGTNTDIGEQKKIEVELRKSKERLDLAVEVAGLGEWELNLKDHTAARSLRHDQIFGYPSLLPEWTYEKFLEHVLPELRAGVDRKFKASATSWSVETQIRRADGEVRWIWARGRRRLNEAGEAVRMFGVVTDITERKQAEEERARLAAIVESSGDAIISKDIDGIVSSWNESAERLFGYSAEEIVGQPISVIIPPERQGEETEFLDRLRNGESIDHYETVRVEKSGHPIDVSVTLSPIYGATGTVTGISKSVRDITERKQAEHALRDSEQRYRNLFETMDEGFCIVEVISDAEGRPADYRFLQVNPAFEKQTGLYGAVGKLMRELAPSHEAHWFEMYGRVALTGEPAHFMNEARALSRWYDVHAYRVGEPELRRVAIVFNDISGYKRAEAALQASEHRWATTLQSIGDAVISTDNEGNIDFMNEVAQKLTGWTLEEARGKDLTAVFDIVQEVTRIRPESPVAKVIRLGKIVGLANHTVLIHRDGSEIPIEDSAAPIRDSKGQMEGVVLVFHDCLEQRKVEAALRSSERLATTGRLAATIAHEIHNPLDAVGNLLFLICQDTKEERTGEYASMASSELARVTQLTQQMLGFQREATRPLPVKIGEILENVVALYDRKIKTAGIHLEQQIHGDVRIIALPGELRQIFANLLGNAIEAVGSRRGTIAIRAYPSQDRRRGVPGICVVVADNGPGIPAEVRGKIFEPFFTTKGESGTGLGLWITSDILRKYDGTMRLRSCTRPERSGTCFSIFLPFQISTDSTLGP